MVLNCDFIVNELITLLHVLLILPQYFRFSRYMVVDNLPHVPRFLYFRGTWWSTIHRMYRVFSFFAVRGVRQSTTCTAFFHFRGTWCSTIYHMYRVFPIETVAVLVLGDLPHVPRYFIFSRYMVVNCRPPCTAFFYCNGRRTSAR